MWTRSRTEGETSGNTHRDRILTTNPRSIYPRTLRAPSVAMDIQMSKNPGPRRRRHQALKTCPCPPRYSDLNLKQWEML